MDKAKFPHHPKMGSYLVVHYGMCAEDDSDGMGPWWPDWNPEIHGSREEVEAAISAWEPTWTTSVDAKQSSARTRRQALLALRDGSGAMTAAQLTTALRLLAREILGEE